MNILVHVVFVRKQVSERQQKIKSGSEEGFGASLKIYLMCRLEKGVCHILCLNLDTIKVKSVRLGGHVLLWSSDNNSLSAPLKVF